VVVVTGSSCPVAIVRVAVVQVEAFQVAVVRIPTFVLINSFFRANAITHVALQLLL